MRFSDRLKSLITPRPTDDGAVPAGRFSFEDVVDIGALARDALGPEIVPDPAAVLDPETSVRIDIAALLPLLGPDRRSWPEVVAAYYVKQGDTVRAGHALEKRAATFAQAEPLLTALLAPEEGSAPVPVELAGPMPRTVLRPALYDGDVIRLVLPSMLARWAVAADDTLAAALERVRRATLSEQHPEGHPRIRVLSLGRELGAGLLAAILDEVRPDLIGALGALVAILGPNELMVRPLDFEQGLRDDVAAMGYVLAHEGDALGPYGLHSLYFRKMVPQFVEIGPPPRLEGNQLKLRVTDSRFIGVLTAVEPNELLPVPSWASPYLDAEAYTRFAGVAASLGSEPGIEPSGIASIASFAPVHLGHAARICSTVEIDHWPRVTSMVGAGRVTVRWPMSRESRPADRGDRATGTLAEREAPELVAAIRREVAAMHTITRVAFRRQTVWHAGADDVLPPAGDAPDGPFERTYACLVGVVADLDPSRDIDRLMAWCAITLPPDSHAVIEVCGADDPVLAGEMAADPASGAV